MTTPAPLCGTSWHVCPSGAHESHAALGSAAGSGPLLKLPSLVLSVMPMLRALRPLLGMCSGMLPHDLRASAHDLLLLLLLRRISIVCCMLHLCSKGRCAGKDPGAISGPAPDQKSQIFALDSSEC